MKRKRQRTPDERKLRNELKRERKAPLRSRHCFVDATQTQIVVAYDARDAARIALRPGSGRRYSQIPDKNWIRIGHWQGPFAVIRGLNKDRFSVKLQAGVWAARQGRRHLMRLKA